MSPLQPQSANVSTVQHFSFTLNSLHVQFADIIIQFVARCLSFAAGAVQVTLAGLDLRHHPAGDLLVSASEEDGYGLGPVRPAAPAV